MNGFAQVASAQRTVGLERLVDERIETHRFVLLHQRPHEARPRIASSRAWGPLTIGTQIRIRHHLIRAESAQVVYSG